MIIVTEYAALKGLHCMQITAKYKKRDSEESLLTFCNLCDLFSGYLLELFEF